MNIRLSNLILISSLLILSSCLKDKDVDEGRIGIRPDGSTRLVEISGPISGLRTVAFTSNAADTIFNVLHIRLASDKVAEKDITVTLNLDPSIVADYNTDHGTAFDVLPSTLYSFPDGLTATIPKGSNVGYLRMSVIPDDLASGEYALGFSIASVSDPSILISGNWNEQVVFLGVRNKYDGRYEVTGSVIDANGVYTDIFPRTVDLKTVNASTVDYIDVEYDLPYFIIQNINTGGLAALLYPRYVFNTTTDQLEELRWSDDNTPVSGVVIETPNQFDPVTKSFDIKFKVGTRWTITQHYEYTGPRP